MGEDEEIKETFEAYAEGRFAARNTPNGPVTNLYFKDSAPYNALEAGVKAKRERGAS